jgi:hypothetical protein
MSAFPLRFNKKWFPATEWISLPGNKKLYLHTAKQGTDAWKRARKGLIRPSDLGWKVQKDVPCIPTRITASKFSVCDIYEPNRFETPEDYAMELIGLKEKEFTPTQLKNMQWGTDHEDEARIIYENYMHVNVRELGLVVPEWDIHIGVSVDGVVLGTEGIVEIKCPKKMYKPILNHVDSLNSGWEPPTKFYRGHIWKSHYDQMQGGMAILGKEWCDYLVYCKPEKYFYKERILFNPNYWNNCLYPQIKNFYTNILYPLIEDTWNPRNQ